MMLPIILGLLACLEISTAETSSKDLVTEFGTVLGKNHGVIGYSNGNDEVVSNIPHEDGDIFYGMKWQCVEYSRRWLITVNSVTFPSINCASDIWHLDSFIDLKTKKDIPIHRIPNGSKCKPKVGDVLIYKRGENMPYGHVGIITDVTNDYVKVSEQNWSNDYWNGKHARKIDRVKSHKGYYIDSPDYPILGWIDYKGNRDPKCYDEKCKTCTKLDPENDPTCTYL